MEEMKKWVDKKKQKLDIITWLNILLFSMIVYCFWIEMIF